MFGLSDSVVKLAGEAILALAALAVLWFFYDHTTSLYYDKGVADTQATADKKDAAQAEISRVAMNQLTAELGVKEAAYSVAMANTQNQMQQERTSANQTIADLNARIAAGFRLRDPGVPRSPANASSSAATVADNTGPPGPGAGELSEQFTQQLASESNRADNVVIKLNALQSEALALQAACGIGAPNGNN